MKKYIIGILLFLQCNIFAQGISVELSIQWEAGINELNNDSSEYVPMLYITYRNNTDANYYLLKIYYNDKRLPDLPWGTMLHYPIEEFLNPNYLKRAKLYHNHYNENYNVIIWNGIRYTTMWEVVSDTANLDDERETDFVNDELANIYQYIYHKYYGEPTYSSKFHFDETDFTSSSISDSVRDRFVFLKAGESYADSFNLIAFKIVGGNYTFTIDKVEFKDYVAKSIYTPDQEIKFHERQIKLPKEVDGYKLYSGKFLTNDVTVKFNRE